MPRTKVRKHSRRVGRKKVKVTKHKRRIHKGRARITKKKRKVFTSIANRPFEVGGELDFEDGELENAKLHFGSGSALEFDWDPNYEVSFHTHPTLKDHKISVSVMPSFQDILSMKQTNEKEQIIFYRRVAVSIKESERFQTVSNIKIKQVSDGLQTDFERGMSDMQLYKKYKPIFRKELGLDMLWHKPGKDIELQSRSI